MKDRVFQALADAARKAEPVALGVISKTKGSSPQKVGAKALFYCDGRIVGTLGGGCLEAEVQKRAVDSLRTGRPAAFDLVLDHDFGWDDGLICGGKVEGLILPNAQDVGERFWTELQERGEKVNWGIGKDFSFRLLEKPEPAADSLTAEPELLYSETVAPPCSLWIAGAGHIAQAVAPLAMQLDFDVTVFDDRPTLVTRQVFPEGITLQTEVWEKLLATPLPQKPSFGLIVTRGHRHDALVLQEWVHKPFMFLGMIGSARKARIIFEHFKEEKLATEEELKRVVCPVGLRIRSQTVPEIAVSIMAQFIEKRAELSG
jgi:xanthine dehydrogenase accessory factor